LKIKLWSLYSTIGLMVATIAPVGFFLLRFEQRPRSFYYLTVLTVVFFFMNIFKLYYHNPRPYWVDPDVEAYQCPDEYGNPSGHSETSLGIAMTVWLDYNHYVTRN